MERSERRLALILGLLVVSTSASDPNEAADGIYTECVFSFSYPCLQRKALMFIDRMGRAERFPLIGDGFLSLVRTAPPKPEIKEETLRSLDGDSLGSLVDDSVSDFFQTHIFRVELPDWLKTPGSRADNDLDFYVGDTEVEEGRKKSGGGGGKKGMKKMMMSMCMMMAGKFMLMGPLLLGLTKIMAVKALIMGFVSLTISKIMILKKLQKQKMGGGGGSSGWSSGGSSGGWSSGGGGGGGGGWSSGGGGGYDRSFAAHDLAYRTHLDDNYTA